MFIILSILQVIGLVTGLGFALVYLIPGLVNIDNQKLNRAGIIYLSTFLIFLFVSGVQVYTYMHL